MKYMEIKQDTRGQLLQTALDLMWCESYGGVSVDDICKKANAKKGSFYHYFESKAALGMAALDHLWEHLRPQLDQIFSAQTPPLERLRLYTETAVAQQKELKKKLGYIVGCPFTSIGSEQCSCNDGLSDKANEIFCRMTKYFKSTIKDAVEDGSIPKIDIDAAAQQLLIYELGALSLARITDSLDPLNGFYDMWIAMLRRAPEAKAEPKKRKAA